MNLNSLDLNLLKVLDALLKTSSVSKSATQLNVTQSAISHALKRLRDIFADPLLVRVGGQMVATPRAAALRQPLERAMNDIFSLMSSTSEFEPATSQRVFRLAMSDAMTAEGLPLIMQAVRRKAPNVQLLVETGGPVQSCRLLLEDKADIALGVFPSVPKGLESDELYRDQLVCIADRSNSYLKNGRLSFKSFLAAPHVTVSPSSDSGIQVDDILRSMGFDRHIVASVPHYLAIPPLIAGTDLVAHSRRKLVDVFRSSKRLQIMPVPVPFPVPDLIFAQVWHSKHKDDGAQIWLRDVIRQALKS